MAKILGDGQDQRTQAFAELQSYYLFNDKFEPPAKGNYKGKVEGLVGYSRRHFMLPLPVADDFYALNAPFLYGYFKRQRAVLRGQVDTIAPAPGQRLGSIDAIKYILSVFPFLCTFRYIRLQGRIGTLLTRHSWPLQGRLPVH